MADLIALAYIQDGYKRYEPGDIIPSDTPQAEAWIQSGAAKIRTEEPPAFVIAKRAAAQAGRQGIAIGGEVTGDDLVGRIPQTERRQRPWKRPASKKS